MRLVRRWDGVLPAVLQPVALAIHLQDVDVVGEAVQQRSRFVRFYRARNRCEWCGVHNHTLREDTGAVVVLTAAHVYDKRPEACGLLNLAALCQRCHLRHDAKDRAQGKRERARGPQLALAI